MKHSLLAAILAFSFTSSAAMSVTLEKVRIAGWSKPISEITNILAEPDKGFFKAEGIDLGYVPGACLLYTSDAADE